MKNIFFILFLLGFIFIKSFSQPNIKKIENDLVKLNDTLFVSKYEVSNALYKDFISYSILFNKAELRFVQIDSANWRSLEYENEPFAQYYHLHPAYLNYPVVNISYEGAVLFCKWLTECYNNFPKRKYKKVMFRLPSKEEWLIATKDLTAKIDTKSNNSIMPIDFYKDKRLFNIFSNVSEMTITKGLAVGGNWKNKMTTSNGFNYEERSNPFVGFRFFVIIEEK